MMEKIKKNLKLIIMIIPAFIILILAAISFSNILGSEKSKLLILFSLLIIYPVIFFFLGYFSLQRKGNIFLLSLPSYLAFATIFFIWLNITASNYIFVYILSEALGYSVYKFKIINTEKQKEKERKEKFYAGRK